MARIKLRRLSVLLLSGWLAVGLARGPSSAPSHADEEGFRFPDDLGGRLLAKLLTPSGEVPPLPEAVAGPRRWSAPPGLEDPALPLPPNQASPARMPVVQAARVLQPRPLPEETLLAGQKSDPETPQAQELLAGPRVRLPAVDVNQPVPLPILGRPVPDRAPLDDPTGEASRVTVLSATPPVRSIPAPFVRLVLPDPFEHRNAVKLRTPLPEETAPVISPPRLPRP